MSPVMWLTVAFFTSVALIVLLNALDTPVVGLLTQEAYLVRDAYPDAHSFAAASYVKLLEGSGARVLPIWIGQDNDYYKRVVNYTNGILFPGGGTYFNETKGYAETAKQLYQLAIKANDDGVHYPLWGICLGMQVLAYAAIGEQDDTIRKDCSASNVAMNINFVQGYETSKMFSALPPELIQDVQIKNLTYHNHRYCMLEADLKTKLSDWKITSKNVDKKNLEFVTSFEHSKYPFYGTQFHPERTPFEFKKGKAIPHSKEAVLLSQDLTNFFVDGSRKNAHQFPSDNLETSSLIYNYDPVYSIANTSYEQLYLWKEEDYPKNQLTEKSSGVSALGASFISLISVINL